MRARTPYKLTEAQIGEIRRRWRAGESQASICRDLDISSGTASYHIHRRRVGIKRKQRAVESAPTTKTSPKKKATFTVLVTVESKALAQVLAIDGVKLLDISHD